MLGGIGVVWGALASNQRVQLSDHEQEHLGLVDVALVVVAVVAEVDQDNAVQDLLADLEVGLVGGGLEDEAELVTEVLEDLGAVVQRWVLVLETT